MFIRALLCALALIPACLPAGETVEKRRLGSNINTPYAEVLPIASADGQTLFFTRANFPDPTVRAIIEQKYDKALADCQGLGPAMEELAAREGKELSEPDRALLNRLSSDCSDIERQRDEELNNFEFGDHPNQAYFARRQQDGSWGPAIRAPAPLNDDAPTNVGNMSIVSAAPDRNTLLIQGDMLFGRQRTDGCVDFAAAIGMGGRECLPLAVARRDDRGHWTRSDRLRTLPFDPPLKIHGAALAPTGDAVVLSAREAGTNVGNFARLYVTRWLEAEQLWSTPDLIEALDGAWNAMAPFIGPDGRSLYFASDRPGGLGGMDIWMSRRHGAGWLEWSEPENLGSGVNSELDETSLSVDASGGFAFLSAGGGTQQDIYEFGLPPNLSPAPTAVVGGLVYRLGTMGPEDDSDGGELFAGEMPKGRFTGGSGGAEGIDVNEEAVVFVSLSTGETAGSARINPVDGSYSTHLPAGDRYAAYVNVRGFAGIGQVVDLAAVSAGTTVQQDLELAELKEGVTIRLNNVYFETNKWDLLEESRIELDRLVGILAFYPTMRISIGGHTDSVDTEAHNLELSTNRAVAVRAYLEAAGVSPGRLESRGYGESRPIASNDDDDGRRLNRRVEFTILTM